ncbi:MAG: RNA polymerase sigma factor [Bradymonadaceae bacterium]
MADDDVPTEAEAPADGASADGGRPAVAPLVERAREGDETAARRLFDRYREAVMGHCVLAADGDRDRAKDLVQRSFITVFEKLDQLDDPASFSSWIWTIVRRECDDVGSKHSRHAEILDLFAMDRDVVFAHEDKAARERRIQCVHEILETIDDEQLRDIVEMKYTEPEHTTREIADTLDIPHGTVTVKLMRFREAIEEELAERLDEIDATSLPAGATP